jgi:hypothetical protein
MDSTDARMGAEGAKKSTEFFKHAHTFKSEKEHREKETN